MSLLSTLTRHGRRRLRPPSSVLHQTSPLITGYWDNYCKRDDDDDDDDDDNKRRQRRNMSCLPATLQHYNDQLFHPATHTHHLSSTMAVSAQRQYHTTTRKEILPLLAVGFVGATAVYTYKTFQQMDKDWDEYYDDLEEYKAQTGIDPEKENTTTDGASMSNTSDANASDDLSNFFTGGTLAIDMGTSRLKLSHRSSIANKSQYKNGKPPEPVVSVDREGFRSTPSLAWLPPSEEEDDMLIGRLAESRSYDTKGGNIIHPREALLENNYEGKEAAIQQTIRAVATNALDQVLGNSSGSSATASSSTNPLFVLDSSMSSRGSYNVRPIFTYPLHGGDPMKYVEHYQHAVSSLTSPAGIADFVPEPVAIVSGAEYYNLLPPKNDASTSVLVVDVGGTSTDVSLLGGEEEILYTASLPFGGDTFIDLLVSHLVNDFYGSSAENTDKSSSETPTSSLSSKPNLDDPSALQRLYEASATAVHELSSKTRSEINIPYLTMDLETRQPKHLEVGMSRNVVDAEMENWVRNKLVPHLHTAKNADATTMLSQALPPPTNLSTLLSSAIMSSLEQTSHTPHMVRAILLVGGGARIPLVREAMKEGVGYLAGDSYASGSGGEGKRLIMPEGEMGDELGVLGAAVWGSGGSRR